MTTYTLEITDVPEDLIELLDQRAQRQAKDRSAYIRELLRRDLQSQSVPEGNMMENGMTEALAPFHEAVQASGYTAEEAIEFFDQALKEVRQERREDKAQSLP